MSEDSSNMQPFAWRHRFVFFAGSSLAALALSVPAHADGLADRQSADAADLLAVERQHPAALASFREAEALLAKGDATHAVDELQRAKTEATQSTVLARRYCQALIQLGKRSEAIEACQQAMGRGQTPMSQRAMVGALTMTTPTPDELSLALRLTALAKKSSPSQPWGFAADCDIARRLGDRAMYKRCLTDLETIAPGHYETLRAEQLGGFAETPSWAALSWLAVAAGAAATLLHAGWRQLKRGRATSVAVTAAALVALSGGHALAAEPEAPAADSAAAPAPAAQPQILGEESMEKPGGLSKWKINDADPMKSVPTPEQRDSDPLNFGYHLMDLADKANEAEQLGNYAQASKYWEATVIAVPEVAVGYRKTCATAEQAKQMDRALRFCRATLARNGVMLGDYQRYARILLSKPSALDAEQMTDLVEISKQVRGIAGGGAELADTLDCEHALRAHDMPGLQQCVAKLSAKAPNDAKTITYQWALALERGDLDEARRQTERARKSGMKPDGVQSMERSTAERASSVTGWRRHSKLIAGSAIALAVLGLLYGLSRWVSRRRATPAAPGPLQAT